MDGWSGVEEEGGEGTGTGQLCGWVLLVNLYVALVLKNLDSDVDGKRWGERKLKPCGRWVVAATVGPKMCG